VIGVNCNQMAVQGDYKCFNYCKQFEFSDSVSHLRIGKFL
jgi:hypothetical protein